MNKKTRIKSFMAFLLLLSMLFQMFSPVMNVYADEGNLGNPDEVEDYYVKSIWNTADEFYQPESIEIALYEVVDNELADEPYSVAILSEDNNWSHTFENVPSNKLYEIVTEDIDGYISTIVREEGSGNQFIITNEQITNEVILVKYAGDRGPIHNIYEDPNYDETSDINESNDFEVINHGNKNIIEHNLKKDQLLKGAEFEIYREVDDELELVNVEPIVFDGQFEDLSEGLVGYRLVSGTYYIKEVVAPEGYQLNDTLYKIEVEEGTHLLEFFSNEVVETTETVQIDVEKVWEGEKLDKVTVNLLANEEKVDQVDLSENNDWKYTFTDLPKYENGKKIEYTVQEMPIEGYEVEVTGDVENGFTITNKEITPEPEKTIDLFIDKVWGGTTSLDSVKIYLLANGERVDSVILLGANNWTHTFTNLPVEKNGEKIEYYVEEEEHPNYEVEIIEHETGFRIVNREIVDPVDPEPIDPEPIDPEVKTKEIVIKKGWDGKVGEYAIIYLLANGERIDEVKLSEANNWEHTFVVEDNEDIEYTIEEEPIEGYTPSIHKTEEGFTVINKQDDVSDVSGGSSDNVQTYDPGITSMIITLIMAFVALMFVNKKRKQA